MSKRKSPKTESNVESKFELKSDNTKTKIKYDADYILSIGKIYNDEPDHIINFNGIPQVLLDIYKELGDTRTMSIQNWKIFSRNHIDSYNKELHNRGLTTVHNFAISYIGMGWFLMAAINLENDKVFIYNSGGSNGYDVQMNLDKLVNFRSTMNKAKYMILDDFFELIINSTYKTTYDQYLIW